MKKLLLLPAIATAITIPMLITKWYESPLKITVEAPVAAVAAKPTQSVRSTAVPVETHFTAQDNNTHTRAEAPILSGCAQITYRHKALAGHTDRKQCSTHRNFLPVVQTKGSAPIHWKSACLRVDGTVTPFERTGDGITFGPVASPDSIVTLSYCTGKSRCNADCTAPRDTFLEAIGAKLEKNAVKHANGPAKWDPNDPDPSSDDAAPIEAELRQHSLPVHGLSTFRDWMNVATKPACTSTTLTANR